MTRRSRRHSRGRNDRNLKWKVPEPNDEQLQDDLSEDEEQEEELQEMIPQEEVMHGEPENRSGPGALLHCVCCEEPDLPDDPITKSCKCPSSVESELCCYHYRCLVKHLILSLDRRCGCCETPHMDPRITRSGTIEEQMPALEYDYVYTWWFPITGIVVTLIQIFISQFMIYRYGTDYYMQTLYILFVTTYGFWEAFHGREARGPVRETITFENIHNPNQRFVYDLGYSQHLRDANQVFRLPLPGFVNLDGPPDGLEFGPPLVQPVEQPLPQQNSRGLDIINIGPQGIGDEQLNLDNERYNEFGQFTDDEEQDYQPHGDQGLPAILDDIDDDDQEFGPPVVQRVENTNPVEPIVHLGHGRGQINPNFDQIFDQQFAPYLEDSEDEEN